MVTIKINRKLYCSLIIFELISNIFLYLFYVFANCINVIPPAPKFSVPVFKFCATPLLVNHQGRFSLEISHYPGNREFGGNRNQHMHVVGANLSLMNCDSFPFTKFPKNLTNLQPLKAVEFFPPILRRKKTTWYLQFQLVCAKLRLSEFDIWLLSILALVRKFIVRSLLHLRKAISITELPDHPGVFTRHRYTSAKTKKSRPFKPTQNIRFLPFYRK